MKTIDPKDWPRREIYELFSACDHPFYSVSFEIDVTNLYRHTHEHGLSFYYALSWLITTSMERVEAFRMHIRGDRIEVADELIPSCTDLVPGSENFIIVTLPHGDNMAEFCCQAKEKAAGQLYLFTGFVTERNLDPDDCIPRATWGKYKKDGKRITLTLTLDLNHRTIDGVHVGKLYETLQSAINAL